MKVVVAPDSYKGSLTAVEVSNTINRAISVVNQDVEVILKPMADGGEGTIDAFLTGMNGKRIPITCSDPIGNKNTTYYAMMDDDTAIIEYATIAGLVQVKKDQRNPDFTTSFGLGEALIDALDKGCNNIIIGLGGSATNDGGLGMLQALGMQALDEEGENVSVFGKDVQDIKNVCFSKIDFRIFKTNIRVACDVDNPLVGERGATRIYGLQKGLQEENYDLYDKALENYADLIEEKLDKSLKDIPGAGAAGGLGFALMALGAEIISGATLIGNAIGVEKEIEEADLVITGEGKSDEQTLFGKAPGHIATLAQKHEIPVLLVSGSVADEPTKLNEYFTAYFSIINRALDLESAIENAELLLFEKTKQLFRLIESVAYKG